MTMIHALAIADPSNLDSVESSMLRHPAADIGGKVLCQLSHHFGPHVYVRKLKRPADCYILGHAHKTEHLNVLISGRLSVIMDGKLRVIEAGEVFLSEAGVRKLTYAHLESTLITIHPTDETDIDKLEDELVVKSGDFLRSEAGLDFKRMQAESDRQDYLAFVEETGMKHSEIRAIMEDESDMVPLAAGSVRCGVFPSRIHGRGVFAMDDIGIGEVVAPARIRDKRTPVGRYTNHSASPNAEMSPLADGGINVVAMRPISNGEEVTVNYRQARSANISATRNLMEVGT